MPGQFLNGSDGALANDRRLKGFYDQLQRNGVKLQHQFQLAIDVPSNRNVDTVLQRLTMYAQGAELPSRTQNFAEIQYLAYSFNVPSNMEMSNELTVTINCQKKLNIRHALLAWMNQISASDILGGGSGGGPKNLSTTDVIGTGFIYLMDDRFDDADFTYILEGLYPTNVGEAEVSNASADIVTFSASFKYQFWHVAEGGNYATAANSGTEAPVFFAIQSDASE